MNFFEIQTNFQSFLYNTTDIFSSFSHHPSFKNDVKEAKNYLNSYSEIVMYPDDSNNTLHCLIPHSDGSIEEQVLTASMNRPGFEFAEGLQFNSGHELLRFFKEDSLLRQQQLELFRQQKLGDSQSLQCNLE